MILIDESQRDLLCIVWKDKIDSPVKIFRLTTVTYGTKSAPYLATRSLKQLAIDDGDKYPLAAEVIMSDVYMDDNLTGADDLESGRKLQVQLVSMLKGAGMELHKWAKILLQSLWQLKVDWNDLLPSNLVSYWKSFIDALESINCLDIPRYCLQDKSIRTELHGFSDSSEKAYSAALYLRCINTSGQISVRLLCSKSKVAPLKSITIPRLELCGAVLLSKLLKRTLDAFKVNISQIYLWTDSSIVLAWIKKPLAQLKTFVRNRVSIIQELTESDFWKHVNSENNPADILSRDDSGLLRGGGRSHDNSHQPKDFTYIIINHFHTGAEATLANIRNSFWIPSTRNVVRKILRTCIICRKVSAKGSQQLMADLPAARVTAYRVFSQIALKRFVARRGRPIEIHSDNGRNFVGANNELRKILKALFKVQIEAVLNSRPICPLSNDPNYVETLTPAHFLVGSSLVAVPDPDYTEIPMNRLSRWQLVQRMNQHFWSKWSSEYLNRLQQRPKWCKGNVGLKEGDFVLVKPSENSDSLKWHLARILKLHPGKDNIVRVVTLKDKQGIYKRPVTKIANLPYVN
ncbi:integrase catalytic domain-containing protein [Trichonephila clavipes]|nr:integrase catalytic domain-containing protein [Trichonephila clavipes]